jgi:hypothetical protein
MTYVIIVKLKNYNFFISKKLNHLKHVTEHELSPLIYSFHEYIIINYYNLKFYIMIF